MWALCAAIDSRIRTGAAYWSICIEWPSLAMKLVNPTLVMRPLVTVSFTCSWPYWSVASEPTTVFVAGAAVVFLGVVVAVVAVACDVPEEEAFAFVAPELPAMATCWGVLGRGITITAAAPSTVPPTIMLERRIRTRTPRGQR